MSFLSIFLTFCVTKSGKIETMLLSVIINMMHTRVASCRSWCVQGESEHAAAADRHGARVDIVHLF